MVPFFERKISFLGAYPFSKSWSHFERRQNGNDRLFSHENVLIYTNLSVNRMFKRVIVNVYVIVMSQNI